MIFVVKIVVVKLLISLLYTEVILSRCSICNNVSNIIHVQFIFQDECFTETYISTIGVDFVSNNSIRFSEIQQALLHKHLQTNNNK